MRFDSDILTKNNIKTFFKFKKDPYMYTTNKLNNSNINNK